jgi:hypothetical protein
MMGGMSWSEDEYVRYLHAERQLFAFVLVTFGEFSPEDAEREALERYPYEPPDTECRGLVFHDTSWHWAMLRLHGHGYWKSRPELVHDAESYRELANRLFGQVD